MSNPVVRGIRELMGIDAVSGEGPGKAHGAWSI